ncbi:uncharacterized protein LOC100824729 isoform X2 [Brachypodium distachyon]|uniref:uncharacterized protein LOC100824729 isoform X2 n=1 Tax=Brachypodium distachyon TaxID=15368 RepID=UPI00052FEE8D|nr:uncharacterized protein LOC100824729 isoform X2 [Brachypodium distachyon]|eukprot:XP_010238229.1 uncharacterized protein LOC100824729 isoform X2 [Brachypodium distachyon]
MAAAVTPKTLEVFTAYTLQSSRGCLSTARRPLTSPPYADLRAPAVASSPRPGGTRSWTQATKPVLRPRAAAASSAATAAEGMSDPELRLVLELATNEELLEFEEILYGTSYFSPLIKSIAKRPNSDSVVALDDIEERDIFISKLESRFLYLAADARSIIRGWRPSYRHVLLQVRRKLSVRCSSKLCTADLEAEIFLHLLDEYLSHQKGSLSFPWDKQKSAKENSSLGLNNWKVLTDAAWRIGAKGLESTFLKGGRLAAVNLESRVGLLAAKQGLARAASRYVGLRSVMTLLGPIMWGTLLADIVVQMLGTDYVRIVQAIYAFAQIRLTRSCYTESHEE